MTRSVLIIPDKFKGSLTASQAAEAISEGWSRACAKDALELLPMSDGGDGFGEVLGRLLQAKRMEVETVDAAHRPIKAGWWWNARNKAAIIESAQIIGLALLPSRLYHPFQLDTFGLGRVIQEAAKTGAEVCHIGIGGSATNDAGFGVAKALGWQFQGQKKGTIAEWTGLNALKNIVPPRKKRWFKKLRIAVDVQNPLLGERGASRIYGPQKGLRSEDFPLADSCFRRLIRVMHRQGLQENFKEPGTGAAGGLGFGLNAFLQGRLEAGFSIFSHHAGLVEKIRQVDLVITGEGAIDDSTLMGKGVGEVASLCRKLGKPCIGLAGFSPWGQSIPVLDNKAKKGTEPKLKNSGFSQVYSIVPHVATVEESFDNPSRSLSMLAEKAAVTWKNR